MKKQAKKLVLTKETLRDLEADKLQEVLGGLAEYPPTKTSTC
jgi:hypothetical protein